MNLLIVEGIDELVFISLLDEEIGKKINGNYHNIKAPTKINEDFYIGCLEGITKLSSYIGKLNKRPEKFLKIGFIVDADDSFKSRKESLEYHYQKIKDFKDIEFSSYILPNNNDSGMFEDLCMKISKHKKLIKIIENEIFPIINTHEESNILNEAKAKIMMYLSSQTPLKAKLSYALTNSKKLWDLKSDELVPIYEFILNIKNEDKKNS